MPHLCPKSLSRRLRFARPPAFAALVILGGCATAPVLTDAALESKILAVVRANPKIVIDAVAAYHTAQAEREQQAQETERRRRLDELDLTTVTGDSPVLGSAKKTIQLIEFSDFQCPFCRGAHDTLKTFMRKHAEDVTLVFKHFPLPDLHPQALSAALAAWAAHQQGKFWEYHDRLFDGQGRLSEEFLTATADALALDLEKFNLDRRSNAALAAVQKDLAAAAKIGVSGTPFFLLNRTPISGAVPFDVLERALEDEKIRLADQAPDELRTAGRLSRPARGGQ